MVTTTPHRATSRPGWRRRRLLPCLSLTAALLAACGGAGQSSAGGNAAAEGAQGSATPGAECGEVPTLPPNDPNGLLEDMPQDVRTAFNGWPDEIEASEWADLSNQLEDGPITVGWLQQDSGSPVAASTAEELRRLSQETQDAGEVDQLLVETPGGTGGEVTAAGQVRAYESLVRQDADAVMQSTEGTSASAVGTRPAWRA